MSARVLYIHDEASEEDRTLCQELESWVYTLFYQESHTTQWHRTVPGADVLAEQQRWMASADVILLLISVDFFRSERCRRQMHQALVSSSKSGAPLIVPILLRPVAGWADQELSRFQALPRSGVPVSRWPSRDDAWHAVASELRGVISGVTPASGELARMALDADIDDFEGTLPIARAGARLRRRSPPTRLAVDTDIGSYRVVRELASGKASSVYEAHHRYLRRRAAVKILHHNDAFRSRELQLQWEATATLRAEHPNSVKLYDAGMLSNGTPYLVLEYLDGITLADFATIHRQAPTFIRGVIWACSYVALSAAAAHGRGVIHCDLKPQNIMLRRADFGGWDSPKIFDFGIAQIGGSSPPPLPFNDDYAIGAAPYMSPEQARGYHSISEKSDVYTLGVTLFKLIAGRVPFLGTRAEVLHRHAHEPPPSLHLLAPQTPRYLSGLVKSMLQKAPAARPSMLEVNVHLNSALHTET